MNPSVTQLSNRLLMMVHEVCGTESSVDAHPHPVTDEELTELKRRVDMLFSAEGLQALTNPQAASEEVVTVVTGGKNRTKTRTGKGISLR